MIYTRQQLDQAIDAAERQGWAVIRTTSGRPAIYGTGANCPHVRFRRGTEEESVTLAPWLVDELRALTEKEHLSKCMDEALNATQGQAREVFDRQWRAASSGLPALGQRCEVKLNGTVSEQSGQLITGGCGKQIELRWALADQQTYVVCADDSWRPLADKPVETTGWRKDKDGDWAFGRFPVLASVTRDCVLGDWVVYLAKWTQKRFGSEQAALSWASAKLGVEAPRVDALSPADKEARKILEQTSKLWAEVSGEIPAAGPWKAWPENKPTGPRCLVRLPGGILLAVYCHGLGSPGSWRSLPAGHPCEGVTHFAELGAAP